jgi:hypothetical protein
MLRRTVATVAPGIVGWVDLPGPPIGTAMTCLHEGRQLIVLRGGGEVPAPVALARR